MGKKVYCYLTAYRSNASILFASMSTVVSELQSRGVTPLRQKIEAIVFDARFRRMWEMYLAYCEGGFRAQAINVGQFKLVRE